MSERREPQAAGEVVELEGIPHEPDLNVRAIAFWAAGLVVGTVAFCLLSWWLFLASSSHIAAAEQPISPLREAQERVLPPEPRLQSDPAGDMERLREEERQALERPEWIDRGQGTLRIPIDLAMEVIARRGIDPIPAVDPIPARPASSRAPAASGSPAPAPGSTP